MPCRYRHYELQLERARLSERRQLRRLRRLELCRVLTTPWWLLESLTNINNSRRCETSTCYVVRTTWNTSSSAMAERPREAWYSVHLRLTCSVIRKLMHRIAFGATLWRIRDNISTLCKIFNAKKLCSKVLSRVCQFYQNIGSMFFFVSSQAWWTDGQTE